MHEEKACERKQTKQLTKQSVPNTYSRVVSDCCQYGVVLGSMLGKNKRCLNFFPPLNLKVVNFRRRRLHKTGNVIIFHFVKGSMKLLNFFSSL